jgi:hypothetical protein
MPSRCVNEPEVVPTMRYVRPLLLSLALSAGALPAFAQQVYSSWQAEPSAQARPLTACVYGGQVFTQGAVMQTGTGIVLKCVIASGDERQGQYAAPAWATVVVESKPPVKPRK